MITAMMKVMTAGQLARRLSVSTIVSELNTAARSQDPGQRMPPNREVDLISKVGPRPGCRDHADISPQWRDVDTAEVELQQTRLRYADKMAEFAARWRRLEAGQLEGKQNLIKFNNFVREKQGKVRTNGSTASRHVTTMLVSDWSG